jgi:hypothetical protein
MEPALAKSVRFTAGRMHVLLDDGREISIPIDRYPRLRQASPAQRRGWQISAFGTGIRWPEIDEDIGIAGILGVPEELIDEAAGFTIHKQRR